jgi:thymidylate synthase (FAD)
VKVRLLSHTDPSAVRGAAGPGVSDAELLPHLAFTYAIEGVSRACSHQIVRHRVASFSQQSQRYIEVKRLEERIVTPPTVAEKASGEYSAFVAEASRIYGSLVASGVPKEDARFVLPNAAETSLIMTLDGGSLMHFFGLRLCRRAQWEVRALAEEMLREARGAEPSLFSRAGPYCVQLGRCTEGRFSCGRSAEMHEKYLAR